MNGDKNKKNSDKQDRYKVINRPNVIFFANFFSQNHRFAIAIVTNIVKKLEKNTDFPILKKNFVCKIKDLQNFFFPNNYEQ